MRLGGRLSVLLPAALAAALIFSGCGGGGNEETEEPTRDEVEIRAATREFLNAAQRADYEKACSLYAEEALEELGGVPGCAAFYTRVGEEAGTVVFTLPITKVTIDGDEAYVSLEGARELIEMEKEDGEWIVGDVAGY